MKEIRQIAINFIKTLSLADKEKIKTMMNHGIICGSGYAIENGTELQHSNRKNNE